MKSVVTDSAVNALNMGVRDHLFYAELKKSTYFSDKMHPNAAKKLFPKISFFHQTSLGAFCK
jgi:hypothetical protein